MPQKWMLLRSECDGKLIPYNMLIWYLWSSPTVDAEPRECLRSLIDWFLFSFLPNKCFEYNFIIIEAKFQISRTIDVLVEEINFH